MHNTKMITAQKIQGKDSSWQSSASILQLPRDSFMKDLKFKATVLTMFILVFCLNTLGYLLL